MIFPIDALAYLSLGLILLLAGGHYLIPGTIALAGYLRLSPALLATLIVAGGTSAPELMVSIDAAIAGRTDLIWGNVIGSNITNILLVMGLGALMAPIAISDPTIKRDTKIMLLLSLFLVAIALIFGALPLWGSILLVLFLVIYIWQTVKHDKPNSDADQDGDALPLWRSALYGVGGIAGLLLGAELIVDNAVIIASMAGLSEALIGLTIVAIGTSLPEIATSVASMIKGRSDVAIGSIIGSNIFNIAAVMGIAGLLGEMPAPAELNQLAFPVFLASALLLMVLVLSGKHLSKRWAVVFIGFFAAYMIGNII